MANDRSLSLDEIFVDLLSRCDPDGYTTADEHDLDRWANKLGVSWLKVLDLIGVELAKRYHAGSVDYAFGDSLANDLYVELIERLERIPEGAWPAQFDEVYLAFDAGEFQRAKDGDSDPVCLYTDPAVAEFVAKLS